MSRTAAPRLANLAPWLFLALGILGLALSVTVARAQQQSATEPTGDAARGKTLFITTYKCYACHGYAGQTGERRLVPMQWPQEAFIGYVQNSPVPTMPSYSDVPAQDLADVYAYIRSLQPDAPAIESVPLLRDIATRRRQQ